MKNTTIVLMVKLVAKAGLHMPKVTLISGVLGAKSILD